MLEDFSVERTIGILAFVALPLFTGCAVFDRHAAPRNVSPLKATAQPDPRAERRIQQPVVDNTPLKLIAAANDRSNLVTDVIGIENCKQTALAFTKLKASFGGTTQVYASCLPQKGGEPVVSYSCSGQKRASSCELVR